MLSDHITTSSPGGLMPGMSVEAFMNGRYSYLRNPILANVLHRLKIVEIFATGIKRIKESYSNYANKPIFDVNDSYIAVTLPLKREISLSPAESRLFSKMNDNYAYSRIELEKLSGMGKDSTIRALNSLIEKGFIAKDKKASNTSYRKIPS